MHEGFGIGLITKVKYNTRDEISFPESYDSVLKEIEGDLRK